MITAVYDLKVSPPTFDFLGFLVSAERERIKRGEDSLRVLIVPGPKAGFRDDDLPPYDTDERMRMIDNVVIPLCSLLPSCVECKWSGTGETGEVHFPTCWTPDNRVPHYGMGRVVTAFKAGCFPLAADAPIDEKLVTITLRQSAYWPTRNSNLAAWDALKSALCESGFKVMVIDDDMLPNAAERAKVYAAARLNLFVNNGPAWMAAFMPKVKGIVFKMTAKDAPCVSSDYFSSIGFPVGSRVRDGFRIVWADDDAETLVTETFKELGESEFVGPRLWRPVMFDKTLNNEAQIMLEQVKENLKRELPWFEGGAIKKKAMLLVGGGPSLTDTLPNLRLRYERGADVFALNGVHDWLIERGLIPQYHVMLDSRQENARFVTNPHMDVNYLISAFCHRDVFEALAGYRVTLWMSDMEGVQELVSGIQDKPVCLVGGGATVGLKSLYIGYLMGYRKFHLFGMDSSYRDGKNHAYNQPMNDKESRVEIKAGGRVFTCAPWMAAQAEAFKGQAKKLAALGCEVWVHGDGLIPWIAMHMSIEEKAA